MDRWVKRDYELDTTIWEQLALADRSTLGGLGDGTNRILSVQ